MDTPLSNGSARRAEVERATTETKIAAKVNLDGTGSYDVATGVGFLDHMLEQLAKHSLIDIAVKAEGDLHIDNHHTTEDTGIALGQAVAKALGDRRGINLAWRVSFTRDKLGDMDTELFREWFHAFAQNAGITLHVDNLEGVNNHHIIESCFKALARALRQAIAIDPRQADVIPSTKGRLSDGS